MHLIFPSSGSVIFGKTHVTVAVIFLSSAIIGEDVVNAGGVSIIGGLFGGGGGSRPLIKYKKAVMP
jgi:hypothetical protein